LPRLQTNLALRLRQLSLSLQRRCSRQLCRGGYRVDVRLQPLQFIFGDNLSLFEQQARKICFKH
jgi:hypothetical protein